MIDNKKVEEILKRAGEIQLSFFGKNLKYEVKDQDSIVTEADKQSEKFLIQELGKILPEAAFFAEESGVHGKSDYCWVIDPLDGTTNFSRGLDYFCISVALTYKNEPILAFIYVPTTKEMFFAKKGEGAFLNGQRIKIAQNTKNLLFALSFPYEGKNIKETMQVIEHIKEGIFGVRMPGAVALDLANLAAGRFDGVYFSGLGWWDVAAGMLLVSEAGCKVSENDGSLIGPVYKSCVAGSVYSYEYILSLFSPKI